MSIDEFISSNPTKEDVISLVCRVANDNVLGVDETFVWYELADLYGLHRDDFYDDIQSTIDEYGSEAVSVYGLMNWRFKSCGDSE